MQKWPVYDTWATNSLELKLMFILIIGSAMS